MDAGAFTGYTTCGRLADYSSKVTGLVHDLGKLLYFFGSEYVLVLPECDRAANTIHPRGQWDVVGVRGCLGPPTSRNGDNFCETSAPVERG